ncbi:MAG TPA: FAD-dependent oxidoreductase [Candidatus Saccharimonadales bacterium]|nr:FAD-dependent oxidoreductase [Candidatus Saccharimonadales bacterium]
MTKVKQVVIVGGGFAGVKAARELTRDRRFQVTLISNRPTFEYHAALYRSATGRSQLEVAVPLKEIFAKTKVKLIEDEVVEIDATTREVKTAKKHSFAYDELILVMGSVTAYFGIKGLPEYSYTIKTIDEAERLKKHLHTELTGTHKPDLNYVVVGAGPSGIELAGEMVSYLKQIRGRHGVNKPFHIDLIEAAPRILPNLPEGFSRRIHKRLESLGVRIYTSTAVKGETADMLQLPEGDIKTHTVIWTAGMTNAPFFKAHDQLFKIGKGGKAEVDAHLQAAPHIWVGGDSAMTAQTGWAQTAIYDGKYIADSIKRQASGEQPEAYNPPQPIGAIPVGPGWCAVNMSGRQIYGYRGWLVRRWSDLKLYRSVMPARLAVRSWLMGRQVEEDCPQCRRA